MLESRAVGLNLRAIIVAVAFAAVVFGSLDRRPRGRITAQTSPDREMADYPRFLEAVATRTVQDDAIALLVPRQNWSSGQSYAFYRASYFLAGRRVIPLVDPDDSWHPERIGDSRYLAVWRTRTPPGSYDEVWSGHGGVLLRRRP